MGTLPTSAPTNRSRQGRCSVCQARQAPHNNPIPHAKVFQAGQLPVYSREGFCFPPREKPERGRGVWLAWISGEWDPATGCPSNPRAWRWLLHKTGGRPEHAAHAWRKVGRDIDKEFANEVLALVFFFCFPWPRTARQARERKFHAAPPRRRRTLNACAPAASFPGLACLLAAIVPSCPLQRYPTSKHVPHQAHTAFTCATHHR